jgi:hypothetical protein
LAHAILHAWAKLVVQSKGKFFISPTTPYYFPVPLSLYFLLPIPLSFHKQKKNSKKKNSKKKKKIQFFFRKVSKFRIFFNFSRGFGGKERMGEENSGEEGMGNNGEGRVK